MGVLHGRDLLSSKWVTAIIFDSGGFAHFTPIKYVLGNYFVTDINNKVYCFEIIDSRVKTYRQTLVKSFRFMLFDTTHALPISTADNAELDKVLRENSLPKLNMKLFSVLKAIGSKEKKDFAPFELKKLVEEVSKNQGKYNEQTLNLINYLENLNIDEIVSPVKSITEFIEEDLLATKPGFYGDIVSAYQRTDIQHKKINNMETTGKIPLMKLMLVVMMVAMVGFVIYYGYEQGWFNAFTDIGKGFEGFQGIPSPGDFGAVQKPTAKDDAYYQNNYTPTSLRKAVDCGEIAVESLPKATAAMVESVPAQPCT